MDVWIDGWGGNNPVVIYLFNCLSSQREDQKGFVSLESGRSKEPSERRAILFRAVRPDQEPVDPIGIPREINHVESQGS